MKKEGGGRRTKEEVCDEARRTYSVELIPGITGFSKCSKGTMLETFDMRTFRPKSFYVHQNGFDFAEWHTGSVPKDVHEKDVVFVFWGGNGIGSAFPQPTGQFDLYLNNDYKLSFKDRIKEDSTFRKGDITLHFCVKNLRVAPPDVAFPLDEHIPEESMESYCLVFLKVPKNETIEGNNLLKICSNRKKMMANPRKLNLIQPSKRWFRVEQPANPDGLLFTSNLDDGLKRVCSQKTHPEIGEYKVFFGDLHAHSAESTWQGCGTGTIDENYQYARDVAALDIFALAEHDWQMPEEEEWKLRLEKADEYNEEDCFVTLPSYEWTSQKYGHRNVYYAESRNAVLFESGPKLTVNEIVEGGNPSPSELWAKLRECGAKAITIPHHPNVDIFLLDWTYTDPEFDRLAEIYSVWGSSEYYGAPLSWPPDRHNGFSVQDAVAGGHRLGFMASSDCHDAHPGNSETLEPTIGSGLVAVLASRLRRSEIFDALYERRCYATTGARILLDFKINGYIMGSEVTLPESSSPRAVYAKIEGTTDIEYVEVVRNNREILKKEIKGRSAEISFLDRDDIEKTCFYYLRVTQKDREMAWSSPIWLTAES